MKKETDPAIEEYRKRVEDHLDRLGVAKTKRFRRAIRLACQAIYLQGMYNGSVQERRRWEEALEKKMTGVRTKLENLKNDIVLRHTPLKGTA